MKRRGVFQVAAAMGGLAAPRVAHSQANRILKFRPNADATIIDPIWTTAYSTRHLALMCYDTLYGVDDTLNPHPQMAAGHVVEDDGRRWRITLRDGLKFHDGEPVRARDCVASIRRWGRVDTFGQLLMAVTEEIAAPSDKEIVFRLRTPFPLLPNALGKSTAFVPVIMPERLITDPTKQVTEVVGSGPFRFLANERVSGVRTVYERFRDYTPRADGPNQFTAGPKVAHLDRVEWQLIPDPPTAAAALISGEIDWYEDVYLDLIPMLRRDRNLVVGSFNPAGSMGLLRLNHLQPPFDNPAIRRIALAAVDQTEVLTGLAGNDRSMWTDGVGVFTPGSPMANDAGIAAITAPKDYARLRRDLEAAGYRGEKIAFLQATTLLTMSQPSAVSAEQLRRAGFNVDVIALDFGVWLQRRASRNPVDQNGWSATTTLLPGFDLWDPISHLAIRGNGLNAWPGWPISERLETLRNSWVASPTADGRRAIARQIQEQVWVDVPYIPLGRWIDPTAHRRNITGMLQGAALFYNLRKN